MRTALIFIMGLVLGVLCALPFFHKHHSPTRVAAATTRPGFGASTGASQSHPAATSSPVRGSGSLFLRMNRDAGGTGSVAPVPASTASSSPSSVSSPNSKPPVKTAPAVQSAPAFEISAASAPVASPRPANAVAYTKGALRCGEGRYADVCGESSAERPHYVMLARDFGLPRSCFYTIAGNFRCD